MKKEVNCVQAGRQGPAASAKSRLKDSSKHCPVAANTTSFYLILLDSGSQPGGGVGSPTHLIFLIPLGVSRFCLTRKFHARRLGRASPRAVPVGHGPCGSTRFTSLCGEVTAFANLSKSRQVKAESRQARITQPASHKRLKHIPAQNESRQDKPLLSGEFQPTTDDWQRTNRKFGAEFLTKVVHLSKPLLAPKTDDFSQNPPEIYRLLSALITSYHVKKYKKRYYDPICLFSLCGLRAKHVRVPFQH